jgi:enterochelin esterase family protein
MSRMKILSLVLFVVVGAMCAMGQKRTAPELIALAQTKSPDLHAAIESTFDAKNLKEGTAWLGRGPEFFFALEAASAPALMIDDAAGPVMAQIEGTQLWYGSAHIEPVGRLHAYHYMVSGAKFGGRLDLPAYGPLSYLQPSVATGKLSDTIVHTSKIYDGMKSDYLIYVPAQYDPQTPAAVMVFQDGHSYKDRDGNIRILDVIDNLIAQKKIPVMICIFIDPGDITGSPGTPTYNFV